ncbi:hypothetical protein [Streptomyces sp. B15]|uniref:hypothetical protein n=1 Tax=Streptomyces sp. B15 TaxID=1537797 RepID=UPI001B362799|nr:hypothetical protein [Streptomyces sp. B15]MBQ1122624.1 hypothetical protein [Streptomyces sp. B15]
MRPLSVWARRSGIADRLARGSAALARRHTTALANWVAQGRRGDLDGWRAALGPVARLAALAALAWLAYHLVRALPWLMWLITARWCLAAWRAGKPAAETASTGTTTDATERPSEDVYDATLAWIWQMVGDRQGVHLRDLLANAQQNGLFEGLDVAAFRAHLVDWDIPVRKRVRVRGSGVSVGIHRDDLPALSQPLPADSAQGDHDPRLHAA